MSDAVAIGDLGSLADGELRAFGDVGPCGIVVCRVDGALYALDDRCSHADTPLRDGQLRGALLTCPLHGAQFDVRDGAHTGPPAFEGVPAHRVEETDGGAIVHLRPVEAREAWDASGTRFRTR